MYPTLASLRRAGALAWALFLTCLAFTPAFRAAAPVNDTCAGALIVPSAGPFPYWTPVVEISGATTTGDEVLPLTDCGDASFSRSVWFKFTPPASALYTLSVGADTATDFGGGDNNETMLAIYTAPDCSGPFTYFACNDDSGGLQSAVLTNLNAGTTYFVVVRAGVFIALTNQPLHIQLKVSRPTVPASDSCGGAEVIPGNGPFPYFTSIHDSTLATEDDDPVAACQSFRSVWFRFTPAASGTYVFSTDTDTETTVFDTALGLFGNTGGCEGTFSQIDCADDFGSRLRASMARALTANVPVYLLVWDFDEEPIPGETSVQLRVTREGPPTVVTLPASSITTTGVVLNMSINQNNIAGTRHFFEWGADASYGNMTPSRLTAPSSVNLTVQRSETISAFTPGLTYHYRAVGSNSAGKVFGLDQTFIASTNPPVITTQSVETAGNFRLQFTATPGQLYIVQGSTDLANWTDLGPPFALGGGQFEYVHSPGANPPFRFYKVRAR